MYVTEGLCHRVFMKKRENICIFCEIQTKFDNRIKMIFSSGNFPTFIFKMSYFVIYKTDSFVCDTLVSEIYVFLNLLYVNRMTCQISYLTDGIKQTKG